jgi:molybdopterin-containing oxidoreductase family iron-sulfur binding subunit
MIISRKRFLQVTGVSLLVAAGEKLMGAFSGVVPSEAPAPALTARRWAMVVDLPKCYRKEGCIKCIEACHAAHNVPKFIDHALEVKWIWKDSFENVFPSQENHYLAATFKDKPALAFCNHCDNPPCVRVCPTQATWKREDGIVMMDWHRCIGCRYCMAACPYGSRSFNWTNPRSNIAKLDPDFPTRTKGVVEKCTFCEERLGKGKLPACVEACPEKAMAFGDLDDSHSQVRELLGSRYSIRRKPELGTQPEIFYLV